MKTMQKHERRHNARTEGNMHNGRHEGNMYNVRTEGGVHNGRHEARTEGCVHNGRHEGVHGGENFNRNYEMDAMIKTQVLDYIYSKINLANYKYKILETDEDLKLLSTVKYISLNKQGSNCLMVFIKVRDRYYSYMIDRKTLNYDKTNLDVSRVIFHKFVLNLDVQIYDGTIFDGIYTIYSTGLKEFVITDAYHFRGKDMIYDNVNYKLMHISSYIKNNYNKDNKTNSIKLYVNQLFEMKDIRSIMTNRILFGLSFYPEFSGMKLIFKTDKNEELLPIGESNCFNTNNVSNVSANDTNTTNVIKNTTKEIKTIKKPPRSVTKFVAKTKEQIIATFEYKKTDKPDVYRIYLVVNAEKEGKKILKTKCMGIAYIQHLETSRMCSDAFAKKIDNSRVLIDSEFVHEECKWKPIKINTDATLPSNISTLEDHLEIVEEEYEDNIS